MIIDLTPLGLGGVWDLACGATRRLGFVTLRLFVSSLCFPYGLILAQARMDE